MSGACAASDPQLAGMASHPEVHWSGKRFEQVDSEPAESSVDVVAVNDVGCVVARDIAAGAVGVFLRPSPDHIAIGHQLVRRFGRARRPTDDQHGVRAVALKLRETLVRLFRCVERPRHPANKCVLNPILFGHRLSPKFARAPGSLLIAQRLSDVRVGARKLSCRASQLSPQAVPVLLVVAQTQRLR